MTKYRAPGACAALIALDQLFKSWAVAALSEGARVTVIPGLFYLSYVENRGAAFGIFQDRTATLAIVSAVIMIIAVVAILAEVIKSRFLIWSVSLVLAGGVGNCIDRFARGYVVDYLDFSALLGFPVFNFADCCVVCGTVLILVFVLYTDRKLSQLEAAAAAAAANSGGGRGAIDSTKQAPAPKQQGEPPKRTQEHMPADDCTDSEEEGSSPPESDPPSRAGGEAGEVLP